MPVTAKLSRKFYNTFGDEVANELVDWFNAVDLTYRTDLGRMLDSQTDRYDDRLERRFAEFEVKTDRKFAAMQQQMDGKFAAMQQQMDERFAAMQRQMDERFSALEVRSAEQKAELIKWMFLFWVGSVGVTLAARLL